jgi:membrane protease YdiL (CAAX protease family)
VALLGSAVLAFLILVVGQGAWTALLAANFGKSSSALPWSAAAMAVVLWLMWNYLGGYGWPRSTAEKRRYLRRANPVRPKILLASFFGGLLALIALAGYWIVFFQLVKTPPNVLPDLSTFPVLTVVLVVTMSSLVSPIVEEIAFRGYCQQLLERQFSPVIAILISSLLFMLAHANHGLYWTKLSVYFLVGVVFGLIAFLTNSILASLPVHIAGDLMFFVLIWPHDSARVPVTDGGTNIWFWIHLAQAIVFTAFAWLTFRRMALLSNTRNLTY